MSLVEQYHRAHKARLARLGMMPVTATKPEPAAVEPEPIEMMPLSALDKWIERQKRIHWFHIVEEIEPAPRVPRIAHIQALCAERFNVTPNDILSQRRTAAVVKARQVACYIAKELTPKSLPAIGKHFGNRDHTTILHSVRKIAALRTTDPELADKIESIKSELAA